MQEKQLFEEKAQEKFEEWQKKKKEEEKQERYRQKHEHDLQQQKHFEKKIAAENAYKLWLRKNKKKISKHRSCDDKLTNLYNPPSPVFVNPLPWVGAVLDDEKSCTRSQNKKRNNEFCSPPMLWEEVEKRQKRNINRNYSTRKSSVT